MKVDMPVGIKNKFTFHVDDIVTGEHREYEAYNIVLNAMWSRLVNFQPFFVNIHFGTGTGAFNDPARTSLYTHLGTKTATTEFEVRDLPTSQRRRKIVLNPEEYIGATITEIGVAWGSNALNLVTHAAPKDAEGNPIAIGPKTDTQIITIYADMYFVLAENMYGGKIKWVTPLENNELLSYLMGGTYPTQAFMVTKVPSFDIEGTAPGSHGKSSNMLTSAWTKDVANKKVTTPAPALTVRLGAAVGNGIIRGFGLGSSDLFGTFRGHFPITGALESTIISENIGAGDGVNTGFNLSWNDPQNLTLKIDEVPMNGENYTTLAMKKGTNIFEFKNVVVSEGNIGNAGALTDGNKVVNTELPAQSGCSIDVGISVYVGELKIYRTAGFDKGNITLIGSNNSDFTDGETLVSLTMGFDANYAQEFTPKKYRYFKIKNNSSYPAQRISEIELITTANQITFTTPPALGSVITADYTVDYIPKDEFHVLDLQAAIQYGEVI